MIYLELWSRPLQPCFSRTGKEEQIGQKGQGRTEPNIWYNKKRV